MLQAKIRPDKYMFCYSARLQVRYMKDKRIHNPRRTLRLRRDESIDGEKIHSNVAYLLKFSIDLILSVTDLLPLRLRKAEKIFRGGARETNVTRVTQSDS